MIELLRVLSTWLAFLVRDGRYRLVDSDASHRNGGEALIVLASDDLRWYLTTERGQISLEVQPLDAGKYDWYSTGLFMRLLPGGLPPTDLLDEAVCAWLEDHLPEIERRFREERPATERELKRLMRVRMKERLL